MLSVVHQRAHDDDAVERRSQAWGQANQVFEVAAENDKIGVERTGPVEDVPKHVTGDRSAGRLEGALDCEQSGRLHAEDRNPGMPGNRERSGRNTAARRQGRLRRRPVGHMTATLAGFRGRMPLPILSLAGEPCRDRKAHLGRCSANQGKTAARELARPTSPGDQCGYVSAEERRISYRARSRRSRDGFCDRAGQRRPFATAWVEGSTAAP